MERYTLKQFLEIPFSNAPSFSPDNTRVAFLSNQTGTMQVYMARIDGSEYTRITDYEDRIVFATFLPGKDVILFSKDVGGNEQTQLYLYDTATEEVRRLTEKDEAIYRYGGVTQDAAYITYGSNERNGKDFDIYVMHLESGDTECVYRDADWCDAVGFSPNGRFVAVRDRRSLVHDDLLLVDRTTGNVIPVTVPGEAAFHGAPKWLSDSSGFYFTSNADSEFLCVDFYDVAADRIERKLECGWDVERVAVAKDDSILAIVVNEDGYDRIRLYDRKRFTRIEAEELNEGIGNGITWSYDSAQLAFTHADSVCAPNVRVWSLPQRSVRQISPAVQTIPPEELVRPELIHYPSFDELSISSFLYLPRNTDGKLPVIVMIHGGPEAQYQPSFNPLIQYFLHRGYAVAAPNVRGSTGYGKHFLTLDDKEKRLDAVQDIVYLRHYLAGREDIDTKRIVLMGGSYGGYMVLANLAFYPEYWAAGVDIVGIANLVTFLENTSAWRRAMREAEYGSLANDRDMLAQVSPINQVERISAPLFIVHGANDPRVPCSEAVQIHERLTELGRDVSMIIYDDEGHGLAKLHNRIDAYTKALDFLDAHLK